MPSPRISYRTASTDAAPIPDEEDHEADLPLTMTASVVLTSLPRDATAALAAAGAFEKEKGIVFLSSSYIVLLSPCTTPISRSLLTFMYTGSYSPLQSRRQRAHFTEADLQDFGDAAV